jgi:hypothetical protein
MCFVLHMPPLITYYLLLTAPAAAVTNNWKRNTTAINPYEYPWNLCCVREVPQEASLQTTLYNLCCKRGDTALSKHKQVCAVTLVTACCVPSESVSHCTRC